MNLKNLIILALLTGCSSKPELITKQDENLITNVSTKQIAICQVKCFNRANRGIESVPAVKLFNYVDVKRFTYDIQKCCFDCYRARNEYDDLTEKLTEAAK